MILTLHGATAPAHDYHTGRPGSYADTLRRMGSAREASEPLLVDTVLSRSTFRVLSDMPPLLASHGVDGWRIVVPRPDDGLTFDRLVPRLALALPFALHALSRAGRSGLSAWILGSPLCLLGPWARRALPSPDRSYGEPCDGCAVRTRCPGVSTEYLRRFGDGELRAMEGAPSPEEPAARLAEALGTAPSLGLAG